jgi:hypothetical protein
MTYETATNCGGTIARRVQAKRIRVLPLSSAGRVCPHRPSIEGVGGCRRGDGRARHGCQRPAID